MDRTALEALRKTPGLDLLLKKLSAVYMERIVRLAYTANSLRISPGQCTRIYELMREAAEVLDMPEPELYLMQAPYPNAFAIGMDKYTIVITSVLDEFLKQADEFEDMSSNILDAFYAFEMMRFETHPFPALRAREIKRWSDSPQYRDILRGDYPRVETAAQERRCPRCAASVLNPIF